MCFDWNCIGDGTDVERRKSGIRTEEEGWGGYGKKQEERTCDGSLSLL